MDRLSRTTLDNGLRLRVMEDHSLPRVAMGLVVPRGAAAVGLEQAGLVSYMAELLNRGAGERDALAFAQAVDSLGASLGSASDWDAITVTASGLSRDFDALSALLADAALRPRFAPEEAARLRAQRLAGLERAKDDPRTLVSWNFANALFAGHPYGLPEVGTPETVARFDADVARSAHARFFVPDGTIFYVTGDVAPERVEARARELFGAWQGGQGEAPPRATPPPPPPAERRVVIVDRPDLGQATIYVGHEGLPRTDPNRIAAQVMNIVIGGGGFSSRIMSRVREDEGLAYYAYSGFGMRRDGGTFVAATGTRAPEAGRAIEMILDELERARSDPPSAQETKHARSFAVGRFSLGLETSDAILGSLVDLDVYGLPPDSLDTYRTRVKQLTQEDLRKAALATIHPERVAIVVAGPAEILEPQLERFGPVTVVQP
jgi:zinc protease